MNFAVSFKIQKKYYFKTSIIFKFCDPSKCVKCKRPNIGQLEQGKIPQRGCLNISDIDFTAF